MITNTTFNDFAATPYEGAISKVFGNLLEEHTGHVENKCQALEQNCKNLENSRRELAMTFQRTNDKLSLDLKGLQRRNAEAESL